MRATPLDTMAQTLDGVRAPVLRFAFDHSATLRTAAQSQPARLRLLAWVAVLLPLAGALVAPTWLFLWAPLVLGLPHLVSDVRYLALPRYAPVALRARDGLVAALLVATLWSGTPAVGGLAVIAAIGLATNARWHARAAGTAIAGGLYLLAVSAPVTAAYVLLHGHNVIAIGLAGVVMVGGRAGLNMFLGAMLIAGAILLGAADPCLGWLPIDDISGYVLPESAFAAWTPIACARIALVFVFLQGVHYAVWLRVVPDARRSRPGMRTFASSLRALERDFTRVVVFGLVVLAVALLIAATDEPHQARMTYLQLAGFHAYLELAILGRLLVSRGSPTRTP